LDFNAWKNINNKAPLRQQSSMTILNDTHATLRNIERNSMPHGSIETTVDDSSNMINILILKIIMMSKN
jgi:hypothetical protein